MKQSFPGAVLLGILLAGGLPGGAARGSPSGPGPRLRVVATFPASGATDVLTDVVALRFNRPLDRTTVSSESLRLTGPPGTVPGGPIFGITPSGKADARFVLWTPSVSLAPGTTWILEVTRDVRNARGRPLEDPFRLPFRTHNLKPAGSPQPLAPATKLAKAPKLGPAPKVRWTFPEAGLGSVYTDEVLIRFNRAMDPGSLVGGVFSLFQGDVEVPGSVSFPEDGFDREALFTPDTPLFRATSYQMQVTRDASTAKGRYLRSDFRAGFGTSPFKGGVKPILPTDFKDLEITVPVGRAFHTATALPGGDILIAGGQTLGGTPLGSCFVYRVNTGEIESIAPMLTPRRKHAAVPSRTGGVMVLGGFGPAGGTLATVEVYDPSTNAWTEIEPLGESRASHTATVITGARILVVGGYTTEPGFLDYAQTAEAFNPFTGQWSATAGNMVAERGGHSATLLPDGRVLLAGGTRGALLVNELYDPSTANFVATAQPLEYRAFHAACLTKGGSVLLAGGGPARAEQFFPQTNSFAEAGSCPPFGLPVTTSPLFASLTLISGGGRVVLMGGLVPGGFSDGSDLVLDQVQVWDPGGNGGTGAFHPMLFDMNVPRAAHTVNQLPNGAHLVTGGLGTDGVANEGRITIFNPSQ